MEKSSPRDRVSEAKADALEKIDLHELDLNTENGLAIGSIAVAEDVSKLLLSDPENVQRCGGRVELALRNVAVLADRIRREEAISGFLPEDKNIQKLMDVDRRAGALVVACGGDASEMGGLHDMQRAFYGGDVMLPESAGLAAKMLMESTIAFADIVVDSGINKEDHLLNYFAGNTKAGISQIQRHP
ncbi:MAG: hypothetical protein ACOX0Z_01950 [Candidatus Nanosyncoccaceae bacterium]|jgi:hypothetical protein